MHYIEKAVNQQLRSFICPEQREQELKKGSLTFAQAIGFRRSSETIMIDAIDQGLKLKNVANCLNVTKKKRKRRRGPRILTLR